MTPRRRARKARRLSQLRHTHRLRRVLGQEGVAEADGSPSVRGAMRGAMRAATPPPAPPIALTPLVACDPATDAQLLWHIAREAPELRRWLVANPRADAELLEFVSQQGGPGVRRALEVLLDSLEDE